jgi:ElaB/YqjD/DUF883 family membrane-anchored ribosome-binding protein
MARNPKAASADDETLEKALGALDPALAEALRGQFDDLRAEIARMGETLGAMGRLGADAARGGVAGVQAAAGERLAEAKAKLADGRDEIEDYARANPVKALGLAAGVGLLFGLILARR